ncbi:PstS family phosphate ABC transporter substrate-binding protein [bacterium]|nr:PstS family phosphate ABC transporter substrate-binding protein [bacterium]MBU1065547.1 PstS family phosphate ABC transporter substrate-binding protein [bacterium]MBU1633781.1 PstS family phosphate ABC transporter substrate-binding protein [bacterium]MBU1873532.1 PstS family phosphate ABC transporter substrate-binding protein [bacterium]
MYRWSESGFVFIKISTMLVVLVFLIMLPACEKSQKTGDTQPGDAELQGTISISGAFALYPLTVKWSEEFRKLHPGVRIDISAGGAGKGMTDALSGAVDLGMFSREIVAAEKARGVWWLAVTKDAVLPTISVQNPVIDQLLQQGLTQAQFQAIFIDQSITDWGVLTGTELRAAINVYTRSDACGAAGTWANYLGALQEDLKGVGVYADPGLADAVKKDALGIGYNNTIYIYDAKTNLKYPGLDVIPIDVNANGRIDPEENFYNSMTRVMAAIASGHYPSPPARELYFVAKGKPESALLREFLHWIISDGQQYVARAGYVPLPADVINRELQKLE